jgi:dUTP pyrophosphatase
VIRYFLESPAGSGYDLTFERKTAGSSGYDLHANIGTARVIAPGWRFVFRTGIYLGMQPGIEAQVRPRSGLVRDHAVLCAFGSIDSDYRGEVGVTLFNHSTDSYKVLPGDRIAQLVFAPVFPQCAELFAGLGPHNWGGERRFQPVRVATRDELGSTDRGASGYGSTGR